MKITEHKAVQKPILDYAKQLGWQVVDRETAENYRGGNNKLFFYNVLYEAIKRLNPFLTSDAQINQIIKRLENIRPNIDGNHEFMQYLRGEKTFYDEKEGREKNIKLIDFDNPDNNTCQVTEEFYFHNGKYGNRADVVFLINGIPIYLVENKNVTHENGIEEGLTQVQRYHVETPEILTPNQIYGITHLVQFLYSSTWNFKRSYLFFWKSSDKANFEDKIKTFFDKELVLRFLKDYIVFAYKDDVLVKMILRQHQTRAIEKVIDRAEDDTKHTGLIWHTQGSGKTLTMIVAAQKLMKMEIFEKPTVIMLIDRNELQDQLIKNLKTFGVEAEMALSKDHLQELIKSDYRGIVVTMIHKFDKIQADLNNRKNIFVLVDEAHRTTSSDLGNYMMAALPNATYFGFTGTPIDKISYGKGTFKIFGKDDEKDYLDKYSIAESIEDGTTLPLNYAIASNEFRVPKEILEKEFLTLSEAEGVSDVEELNKILDKAVNTKNFLKSKDRIEKVAKYVADHYKQNVEPLGYKAFLVGVDREACGLYKQAIDKYLPANYSEVVYTSAHNDNEFLKKYYLDEQREKKIRKEFPKCDTLPKILIVTEKLLTGFDAPNLYVMYLDKPMRDHTLLQAIARVNRPYEDKEGIKKPYGLIIDFVGIFDNLEKALAFDSDEVGSVVNDLEKLKVRFQDLIEVTAKPYLELIHGKLDDKEVENIIEYFRDESRRTKYIEFYKELETLYEIISPDKFLRPLIDKYSILSQIFLTIRSAFKHEIIVSRDFQNKTAELVRKHVQSEVIREKLEVYEINDKTLQKLKESQNSDSVKVINLIKSIEKHIKDNVAKELYLITIGERATNVVKFFESKQLSTQAALNKARELIDEILKMEKLKKEKQMDSMNLFIYSLLHQNFGDYKIDISTNARAVKLLFEDHPNWRENPNEKRLLTAEIYKVFIKCQEGMIEESSNIIDPTTQFVSKLFDLLENEKD